MSEDLVDDPLEGRRQFFAREAPPGYAAEWAERLAEPRVVREAVREAAVLFEVGGRRLALDARLVKAVTEPLPVCRVPRRGGGVLLGLVAYAGEVLPCCSLRRLLGWAGEEPQGRMLVLEERAGVRWAVPVERVLGVPQAERDPYAGELSGWSAEAVRGEGGDVVPLLTAAKLFRRMLQAAG